MVGRRLADAATQIMGREWEGLGLGASPAPGRTGAV